jgi:DNA-binding beta-propeller fold protein YncE
MNAPFFREGRSGGRPFSTLIFAGLLSFGAFGSAAASRQAGLTDDEKRPNVVAPVSQFGTSGMARGQLLNPCSAAWGREDRLFVADTGNHRIQVFTPEGKLLYSWGKPGSGPGEFLFPQGIAVSENDETYVADTGNDRVQVFDIDGKFLRQWGRAPAGGGELMAPAGIATRGDRVYVLGGRTPGVQVFTSLGAFVSGFGQAGEDPGQFRAPQGISVDEEGACYVADAVTHRIQKFDSKGQFVLQWGNWGYPAGFFSTPAGLCCSQGRLFVCDSANHRIQVFDRSGAFLYQWGAPPVVEHDGNGRLHFPWHLGVSRSGGHAVVCEPRENRCQIFPIGNARKITPVKDLPWWDNLHSKLHGMMMPVLGPGVPPGTRRWDRNPPVLSAILEQDTHSVLLFDIALRPCYFLTRTAGFGRRLGEFRVPGAVAREASTGRFFVADRGNRRVQMFELPRDEVRRSGFAASVKLIGSFDPALLLPAPAPGLRREQVSVDGLALDSAGHLYVADGGNSAILVFDRDGGWVRAVPLKGGLRKERKWVGLAVSPAGKTIYILDQYNFVLALDAEGALRGSWGRRGSDGDDAFLLPAGIAVDGDGFVYVTDSNLDIVKKFDPGGKLVKAWGGRGFRDGQFWGPQGIAFASPDRIVIDDVGNHRGQVFTREGDFVVSFYKGGSTLPFPTR